MRRHCGHLPDGTRLSLDVSACLFISNVFRKKRASQLRSLSSLKILWLSHGYGYGGDLMYFEGIFSEFHRRFPATRIAIDRSFPVDRYPGLPLWPCLNFATLRIRRRRGDAVYASEMKLPSLRLFLSLREFEPDLLVVIEFTPIAVLGFVYAKLARKRILLLVESDPGLRGAPNNRVSRFIKGFIAKRADMVMTNNSLGKRFLTNLGVDACKILEAPYLTSEPGVHRGISESPSEPQVARVGGKINLLYLNSIEDRKGLSKLITSFGQLSESARQAYCVHVVGDGSKLNAVRTFVHEQGLEQYFTFYGRVDYRNAWRFYDVADLFISPTLADYRSLTGFEAVNCGKPVLISVLDGAHHEVVQQGFNGWTFDPRDTNQLARLLDTIAHRPEILEELSRNSKTHAKKFSVRQIGDNLMHAVALALRAPASGLGIQKQRDSP